MTDEFSWGYRFVSSNTPVDGENNQSGGIKSDVAFGMNSESLQVSNKRNSITEKNKTNMCKH